MTPHAQQRDDDDGDLPGRDHRLHHRQRALAQIDPARRHTSARPDERERQQPPGGSSGGHLVTALLRPR
ncbi:hypothetical protein V3N99_02150 [Dermatophilaceae bacterium Soc4.6]